MSDSKTRTRFVKVLLRAGPLETGAVKPAATEPRNAERIRGRHAAITNNFNMAQLQGMGGENSRHVGRKKVGCKDLARRSIWGSSWKRSNSVSLAQIGLCTGKGRWRTY